MNTLNSKSQRVPRLKNPNCSAIKAWNVSQDEISFSNDRCCPFEKVLEPVWAKDEKSISHASPKCASLQHLIYDSKLLLSFWSNATVFENHQKVAFNKS